MQKDLSGKVAIVTGAGSGIGRAIAEVFAEEKAKIVVAEFNTEGGEETVKQIQAKGGEAVFIQTDVSDPESVRKITEQTMDSFGRIDILVNNAGVYLPGDVVSAHQEDWQKTIDIDLKGVMLACKLVIPQMLKTGKGKIINIASIAGLFGFPASSAYCAAKGGVVNLTREMALDFASKNINVNAIAPGVIKTAMTKDILADATMAKQLLAGIPIGRFGEPEDIAYLAFYLASDVSDFVTGQIFTIDGGQTAS